MDNGIDAILIENMFDRPYLLGEEVGPEVVAIMTVVAQSIRNRFPLIPLGIQILAAANKQAMAVAVAVGAQFVRVEGFAFAAVADEGIIDKAAAGQLLRYRRSLGADDVMIFADVKKKHSSHAITADVDDAATAEAFLFFGANAVVVTGMTTGDAAAPEDVAAVKSVVVKQNNSNRNRDNSGEIKVVVGSGVTKENLATLVKAGADVFIVGSAFKEGGDWRGNVDPARVKMITNEASRLRSAGKVT